MNDTVKQHLQDGVLTLRMNRPEALNALNDDLTAGLSQGISMAEHDAGIRCVVITGGENFMAGGDLKSFAPRLQQDAQTRRIAFERSIHQVHAMIISMRRMPKPVIASVSGAVAGFGMSLMTACDMAIAADTSYFTLAYINIGTSPDGGSTFSLPRIVGAKKAAEIAMLGDRFDAAAAEKWGLVNRVVPASRLEAETEKLAQRLAAGPAKAIGRTKQLLQRSLNTPLESQLQAEAESFAACASEPDFQEGITAFLEKRKPMF